MNQNKVLIGTANELNIGVNYEKEEKPSTTMAVYGVEGHYHNQPFTIGLGMEKAAKY